MRARSRAAIVDGVPEGMKMRRLYLVLALLVVLLGLFHAVSTFRIFDALSSRAVWFASGGLAMVLTGILNLLNRAYGAIARGVRWASICANLAMTVFSALAGHVGGASAGEFATIVGLMAAVTLVSLLPAAAGGRD